MESFSFKIKKEISNTNIWKNNEYIYAELIGFLVTIKTKYITENLNSIERFVKLIKILENIELNIEKNGKKYIIDFEERLSEISQKYFEKFEKYIFDDEQILKSFYRGIFLAKGSINDPNFKYHLEFDIEKEELIYKIQNYIQNYGITFLKHNNILYLKESEKIVEFLAFIGASKSVLEFEEIRVLKDVRNNVNRLVNCETANLTKIINSSLNQIEDIKLIKQYNKFKELSQGEQELANLRLKNKNETLTNLGKMLKDPIGKSGVNHRFLKIKKLAEEIRGSEQK